MGTGGIPGGQREQRVARTAPRDRVGDPVPAPRAPSATGRASGSGDGAGSVLHEHTVGADDLGTCEPEALWTAAADCSRCARAMLLMLLDSPSWVGRRVERVRFRDDQTAVRHTSMDFAIPAHAPRYVAGGRALRLVPLTMMRRKTLVNFSIDDHAGNPVSLIGMRHNQRLTQRMIEVLAEITAGVDATSAAVRQLAEDVAYGTQQQMSDALRRAREGEAGSDAAGLVADPAARVLLERFANNFALLVVVPDDGPPRRLLRYHVDEPLTLHYKRSGYDPASHSYPRGAHKLCPLRPRRLAAALGWRATVIRFPVPAAELTRSYHFEVESPPGVTIDRASITAGRPNEDESERPSWDHVSGGFPMIGLHVCDVPSGSRSRAQVHLRLARRGWLTVTLLSSWLSTVLLGATAWLVQRGTASGDTQDTVATALFTVVAAVMVFVLAGSEHAMASRLVSGVRKAAVASVLLLVGMGALVTFGVGAFRIVLAATVLDLVCAVLVAVAWACARPERSRISPWEQGLGVDKLPQPVADGFQTLRLARSRLDFDLPAIMVESSEGDNRQTFRWNSAIERALVERLCRWSATTITPAAVVTSDPARDVRPGQLPVPRMARGRRV